MLKKLLSFVACVLGVVLSVSPILADSFAPLAPVAPVSVGVTTTPLAGVTGSCLSYRVTATSVPLSSMDCAGNYAANSLSATGLTPGNCIQAGTNGLLTTVSASCAPPSILLLGVGANLNSTVSYLGNGGSGLIPIPPGLTIGHIYLICAIYNNADVVSGHSQYSTTLSGSNTFGGGSLTLAISNSTNGLTSPTALGTLPIPTTTYPGPYTSTVSVAVTPYTVQVSDGAAYSTVASSTTQPPKACNVGVGP